MLTDRYDLALSTASSTARDAYVHGCAAKLTMYAGATEAFDRAIAADPRFALSPAPPRRTRCRHAAAAREPSPLEPPCNELSEQERSYETASKAR
jgi:hypothetical protein